MTRSSEGPDGEVPGGPPEPTIADVMNAFSLDSGRKPRRRRWGRHRPDEADHEPHHRSTGADGGFAGDLYAGDHLTGERYAGGGPAGGYPADGHSADGYGADGYSADGYPAGGRSAGGHPADRYSGDRSFGSPSFDHNDFKGPEPSSDGFGAQPHHDEWDDIESSGSTFVRPYAWTRGRTRTGYSLEIETLVTTSQRGREQLALLQLEHRAVADLCQQARSVAEVAALLKVPLGVAKVLVGDMAGIGLVAVHESVSTHGDIPDLALMERVLSGLRRL
jgi:hypothetical protein